MRQSAGTTPPHSEGSIGSSSSIAATPATSVVDDRKRAIVSPKAPVAVPQQYSTRKRCSSGVPEDALGSSNLFPNVPSSCAYTHGGTAKGSGPWPTLYIDSIGADIVTNSTVTQSPSQ